MAKKRVQKEIKQKVLKYVELLEADGLSIDAVYLFGSYAKGSQTEWSDIDVCVISERFDQSFNDISYLNKYEFTSDDLSKIEGHGFNSYDFNNPYLTLPHEIRTYGIKIL